MSEILLCLEQICDAELKYTTDGRQFKKKGQHCDHKNEYFEDLCSCFIEEQGVKLDKFDSNVLFADLQDRFDSFKKELITKIDLYQQQVESFIQIIINDDQDVQFYKGIINTQFEIVKKFQDKFYLFQEPKIIKEAYCKKMEILQKKNEVIQYIIKDVLERIDQLSEKEIDLKIIKKQDNDNEHFMTELIKLQEQNKAVQSNILVDDSKLAQQQNQNPLQEAEVAQMNQNDEDGEIIYTKYERGLNMGQAYLLKLKTNFENDLLAAQQTLEKKENTINSLKNSYEISKNDLQVAQQTQTQQESHLQTLLASHQDLKKQQEASNNTISQKEIEIQALQDTREGLKNELQVALQTLNKKQSNIQSLETQQQIIEKELQVSLQKTIHKEQEIRTVQDSFQAQKKDLHDSQILGIQKERENETLQKQQVSLKLDLQNLQQMFTQKQNELKSLEVSLSEIKLHEMNLFQFSDKHTSPAISITSQNSVKKTGVRGFDVAIMLPKFDSTLSKTVTFGFKLKKIDGSKFIAVGMCHLDTKYEIDYFDQSVLGMYTVTIDDFETQPPQLYTKKSLQYQKDRRLHSQYQTDQLSQTFRLKTNEIVYCSFNPIIQSLTFKSNSSEDSFVMDYKPSVKQLYPCIMLFNTNDQIQFIQPEDLKIAT